MRPGLSIVLSHPTQYYSPWFRWMAARDAVRLRVFYLWDFGTQTRRDPQFERSFRWDVDLTSGYEQEWIPNASAREGTDRFLGLWNPTLERRLSMWRPSAILLFGYRYATHAALIAWASVRGIPLIFRGDSHLLGRERPGGLKALALRTILRRFSAVTYVGAANRRYFEAFGVPDERLFFVPHAVDHDLFDPTWPGHRQAAEGLRRELGIEGRRTLLFAGKFVPNKQPVELLETFVAADVPNTALIFVGDGPEGPSLRRRAEEHPQACIRILPFANQSEMPSRYLLGDVFVLPSRGVYETWGLAVNEAMHMGVPCLVSDRVGCQQDLVSSGETGWVFHADDRDDLAARVREALEASPATLQVMRENGWRRMERFHYASATDGLVRAVDFVVRSRRIHRSRGRTAPRLEVVS